MQKTRKHDRHAHSADVRLGAVVCAASGKRTSFTTMQWGPAAWNDDS